MNTDIKFELTHLRFGKGVDQRLQTTDTLRRALMALNAVILPLLRQRTSEEAVRRILSGMTCKFTLDSFGVTSSTSNTSPDDAIACMAEVKSRRIPFKDVVYNGYRFTFLLHQDAYDPHGLHRALTTGNTTVLASPAVQPATVPVITSAPPVVVKTEETTAAPAAEIKTVTALPPPVVTVEVVTPEPSADQNNYRQTPRRPTPEELHEAAEAAEQLMQWLASRLKVA